MVREAATGLVRPLVRLPAEVSSDRSGWNGFHVLHRRTASLEATDVAPLHHVVSLQLGGPVRIEWRVEGHPAPPVLNPGAITVLPAGTNFSCRIDQPLDFVTLYLTPEFYRRVAERNGMSEGPVLRPSCAVQDDLLRSMILRLRAEAAQETGGNPRYAESLASAVAMHLMRDYTQVRRLEPSRIAIALPVLRRVTEHIEANLPEPIPLTRLAQIAGLSPWHFARVFKEATGVTPHTYVIRARLQRAQERLREGEASLAEIATQTGFCDQSHLARHFRRVFGLSPSAWRRQVA